MTVEAVSNEQVESESDAIADAFDAAVLAEKDEDATKMDMIQAGATFKNVSRLFNQYMIDNGFAVSKADRDAVVAAKCSGMDLEDGDTFQAVANALVESLPDTTERSAFALIRGYAKRNDLATWTPPKPERTGGYGFGAKFKDFIINAVKETKAVPDKEATLDFIHGRNGNEETSANTKNSESSYIGYWNFAQRVIESSK